MPALECHHGHGRARRPLCRSSLWPSGLKPVVLLRPAPPLASSLQPVCLATTNRLVFETLSSGAAVWCQLGIQTHHANVSW